MAALKLTEQTVFRVLRKHRFPEKSCVFLPNVADRTGFVNRRADAIAMQLWPSRGLTLEGVEIKVSRQDWLKELEQPEKADAIFRYCDHWWLAAPEGVVQPGELPKTWGLLTITAGSTVPKKGAPRDMANDYKVVEAVTAPKNPDVQEPSRLFLASLLRSFQKHESLEAQEEKIRAEATQSVWALFDDRLKKETERLREERDRNQGLIEAFRQAAGFQFSIWDADQLRRVGAVVRGLLKAEDQPRAAAAQLERASWELDRKAHELRQMANNLKGEPGIEDAIQVAKEAAS
jgi:hypothetical protein